MATNRWQSRLKCTKRKLLRLFITFGLDVTDLPSFRDNIASTRGGIIEQCSIPQPRDQICPSSHVDTIAVTNIAVTPAAKPFNVIVGCNTFEGVAAKYRCAIRLFTFALSV